MSTELVFIAGAFVFAGTVYGAVMAGGFALRGMMISEGRSDDPRPPDEA
jgi:hypothetical protein